MLKKQKKVKWIGIAAVAVVVILAIAILGGRQSGEEQKNDPSVRNAVVEKGTIETVVNGSGVLTSTEAEFVRIPDGVVVEELLVSVGESAPQGGKLAAVDEDSVRTAIEATQNQLTSLATQLEGKKNDTKENSIKAGVSGRVKQIYAEEGEQVATVVAEHGGLMVLSLDGKMAVKLNTSDAVKVGDSVSVILSNGSEKKGTVEKNSTELLVTLTDNGPVVGDSVAVKSSDGTELGTGTLEVNSPLLITGSTGTIASILVEENGQVGTNSSLVKLTNPGHTNEYLDLLSQRHVLEQRLQDLIVVMNNSAIVAPFAGTVQTTEMEGNVFITMSSDEVMTVTIPVDELDILYMQKGQKTTVTIDALNGMCVDGTVTGINTIGNANNGVTRYAVEVTLLKDAQMLSNMNASVKVVIGRSENCLMIPEAALNQSGTTTYVYTSFDPDTGTLSGEKTVTTGVSDGVRVEILTGLEDGETVYYRYEEATDETNRPW